MKKSYQKKVLFLVALALAVVSSTPAFAEQYFTETRDQCSNKGASVTKFDSWYQPTRGICSPKFIVWVCNERGYWAYTYFAGQTRVCN